MTSPISGSELFDASRCNTFVESPPRRMGSRLASAVWTAARIALVAAWAAAMVYGLELVVASGAVSSSCVAEDQSCTTVPSLNGLD